MSIFEKADGHLTVDEVLQTGMVLGLIPGLQVLGFASIFAYGTKKTVEGTLKLNKRRRKKSKEIKVLRQTKRSRRSRKIVKQPKPLTKRQMALLAKERLIESLKIIDEMMMDDDGKRAVKQELYREYQWHIKNIIQ